MATERIARTIYAGATKNGNTKVGGWLPFVVDLSPIYGTMRVNGTLYTDYASGTWETKQAAIEAAKVIAADRYAFDDDKVEEVSGCHRCWNDRDPSHLSRLYGDVRCGTCERPLPRID